MKEEEIHIPDFLKKPRKERMELSKFDKLFDEYEKKFNDNPPTEPSSYSEEEWCEILEVCIEENVTVDELFRELFEDEYDYDEDDSEWYY